MITLLSSKIKVKNKSKNKLKYKVDNQYCFKLKSKYLKKQKRNNKKLHKIKIFLIINHKFYNNQMKLSTIQRIK